MAEEKRLDLIAIVASGSFGALVLFLLIVLITAGAVYVIKKGMIIYFI